MLEGTVIALKVYKKARIRKQLPCNQKKFQGVIRNAK